MSYVKLVLAQAVVYNNVKLFMLNILENLELFYCYFLGLAYVVVLFIKFEMILG